MGESHTPPSEAQPARRVTVEYRVSILCDLDLESGRVEHVRVLDEEISQTGSVFDRDGRQLAVRDAQKALALADQAEWPAWQFG